MPANAPMTVTKTLYSQTNFRDGPGKVYMTHPTKALHKFMMQDFVRMRYFTPSRHTSYSYATMLALVHPPRKPYSLLWISHCLWI